VGQGHLGVRDGRERLVADAHQLGGVLGDRLGRGDDRDDGLALEEGLVAGQRGGRAREPVGGFER